MEAATMENLEAMVAKMMKEKGVEDYKIDLGGNSNVGDGYMGEMIFFKVVCKSGECYNLLLKAAGKNELFREITMLKENFDRELYMYNTIFPAIKSFFLDKNHTVLENIPKLYGFSDELLNEALILEDLKQQGFSMWPRAKVVDLDHTLLVVRNLAKWHGTVLAFKDQNPEQFLSWLPQLYDIRYDALNKLGLLKHAHVIFEEILRLFKEKGLNELFMKYNKYKGKIDQFFQNAPMQDRFIITHGDCWINNILFKFEKGKASECKLLDFQLPTFNTPVDDLSFFIYTSCGQDVLDKIDYILHEYYSCLSTTVEDLGSDLKSIFTFSQLEEHWKKYAILGVVTTMEIVKLQNYEDDEVPNFRKICESGETDLSKYFLVRLKNNDVYFSRLLTVFSHFGNKYL